EVEHLVGDAGAVALEQPRRGSGSAVGHAGAGERGAGVDRQVVVDGHRQWHTVCVAAGLGGGLELRVLVRSVALILIDEVVAALAVAPRSAAAGLPRISSGLLPSALSVRRVSPLS